MRRRKTQAISEVIKEALKKQGLNKGMLESRVVQNWSTTMGASVSKATHKIYIKEGVLFVELTSSVIRNELMMWKDQIIIKLNQAAGGNVVKDIVFR